MWTPVVMEAEVRTLMARSTERDASAGGSPPEPSAAAYGAWKSPITAQTVASAALRLGGVAIDGDDIYWIEGRPESQGRNVLVKRGADGRIADVTPPETNVRTRVHEYGGAAYSVSRGIVYYTEFADQRLYRLAPGGAPEPLTPPGDWFYADCSIDPSRQRLVCVREDHTAQGREPVTTLVSVRLDGPPAAAEVIVSGHDFYSTPRFSPDGSRTVMAGVAPPEHALGCHRALGGECVTRRNAGSAAHA